MLTIEVVVHFIRMARGKTFGFIPQDEFDIIKWDFERWMRGQTTLFVEGQTLFHFKDVLRYITGSSSR